LKKYEKLILPQWHQTMFNIKDQNLHIGNKRFSKTPQKICPHASYNLDSTVLALRLDKESGDETILSKVNSFRRVWYVDPSELIQ